VIEAAQSLAAGDSVPDMLADLSRQLTDFLGASACMISLVDAEREVVRDCAGHARPPRTWEPAAEEYPLHDYPRTAAVLATGEPYTCDVDDPSTDPAEARSLRNLGYRSLLMLSLAVEGTPYALVEVYDHEQRRFTGDELRLAVALASEAGTMVARARMAERLEDAYFATLGALAAALEAKDAYTNDHANEIADLAGHVCDELGLDGRATRVVKLGALLHDIGKIGIPDKILHKKGSLSPSERRLLETHTVLGEQLMSGVALLQGQGLQVVRHHHERWDGAGYPDGIGEREIPLGARVFAVADALDAMTSDRPYRRAGTWAHAAAEIVRESGHQFDPQVVEVFRDRNQRLRRIHYELAAN
jgi:putative nucleotidyltransferase with HDIG domain